MLDINLVAVITQVICFLILAFVVAKFGTGPLQAVIDARQKEVSDTLNQIAADRKAMESTRADYERRLAGIEETARETNAAAMKQAQEEAAALLEKAKADAASVRERSLADIDQERKKAIADIRSQMADFAVVAATKVLEREITPAVHRDLVNDFISKMAN